jgi:DnaJ-class molecular chaperone
VTSAEAFALLELPADANPLAVRSAFRALARKAHPDTGGSLAAFNALKEAYDVAWQAAVEAPCPFCQGGKVLAGVGFAKVAVACARCAGTGRRFSRSACG